MYNFFTYHKNTLSSSSSSSSSTKLTKHKLDNLLYNFFLTYFCSITIILLNYLFNYILEDNLIAITIKIISILGLLLLINENIDIYTNDNKYYDFTIINTLYSYLIAFNLINIIQIILDLNFEKYYLINITLLFINVCEIIYKKIKKKYLYNYSYTFISLNIILYLLANINVYIVFSFLFNLYYSYSYLDYINKKNEKKRI